jgi:methyl-accepting chemotaxis protein
MLSEAGIAGRLDTRADASRHQGDFRKVVAGVNDTLDAVIGPLNVAAEYVERISRGDIPELITDNYNGDFNEIKNNLNTCVVAVNNLVADAVMLSEAGVAGRLNTRADATKHEGDFRKIVGGVNDTLDAVIGPLNVAADYVERISRGDIPELITDNYNGDFNEIKNNLNKCITAVNYLVEDALMLSEAAVAGKLDTRANAAKHEGDFGKIVSGVNDTLDAVIGPLNVAAEYVERISRGDIPEPITDNYNGDFNEIKNNLNTCIVAVNSLVEDSLTLSKAGIAGKLDTRADATKHQGDFRKIVEGVNDTLDAVIGPLNVAAEYVERISRGDIPKPITDNYNGDFNEIKNNLNTCIFAVNNLIEDSLMLSEAGIGGKLDTRADATRHEGDFRKIVSGVNDTLDAVIGPLNVAAEYVERISRGDIPEPITDNYNGDFNEIKNNLNTCIVAVNNLVEDAVMLSEAGIAGRLDTRADATKHEGDFRKIVSGVNDTLDAVIGPLNVAAEYVERISRGDIPKPITDKYNGDFNEIKNNLNKCINAVNNLVADSLMLSEAGIAGKLNTRADATRHEGDFRKIVVGVNDTLDAVIGPVNEAIRVSNEFSNGNFRARIDENLHVEGDFINFKRVLNETGISVSEIIKSAKSVTLNVVDSSDEASKGADEVAKAAGNVAVSSQKTSELTRELLYKIEDINKEIIDLSTSNEKIAGASKGILSAADEVVRIGKDAQTLGKDTNLKMESVEKIAKESVIGINSLTEQIKQIDGIVQLINDITSQINLLSLNAAIEAARAGEHGRGFAVVAGEVKNLATKARNATETIENVVMSVQRDSKKTADAITTANNEIIDGVNSVNKTLVALNTIIKNATQVTNDIGDITKAIEGQANISLKVVTASEEGNAMTREVQKEAEGLAAIAEEASASVQEIGAAIHEMTDLSTKLKSEMEVFMV